MGVTLTSNMSAALKTSYQSSKQRTASERRAEIQDVYMVNHLAMSVVRDSKALTYSHLGGAHLAQSRRRHVEAISS